VVAAGLRHAPREVGKPFVEEYRESIEVGEGACTAV